MVNKCIESLEKLVNLKTSADRALYVGSIEKLQLAVCTEGETPLFCLPFLLTFFLSFSVYSNWMQSEYVYFSYFSLYTIQYSPEAETFFNV